MPDPTPLTEEEARRQATIDAGTWRTGASARRDDAALSDCPYTQRGKRWEWEAGWEYQDATLARRAALDGEG